jgi:hypothetical protein
MPDVGRLEERAFVSTSGRSDFSEMRAAEIAAKPRESISTSRENPRVSGIFLSSRPRLRRHRRI